MLELRINGTTTSVEVDPAMPLLWVLRDLLGLTGTKFACGVAACGACTVLLDGAAVPSCVRPVSTVVGLPVLTIEALRRPDPHDDHHRILVALREAWIEEQVPQCGYCQSGMLLAATALLIDQPDPDDEAIAGSIRNLCRCGTYQRVREAIRSAAARLRQTDR